jgi:hypothetical protein
LQTDAPIRPDGSFTARLRACKPGRYVITARSLTDPGYQAQSERWREKARMRATGCKKRESG